MQIIHLRLQTNKLRDTEHFYSDVLGLPLHQKRKDTISFRAGSSLLSFKHASHTLPPCQFAFNIPPNRIDEALDYLEEHVDLLPSAEGERLTNFPDWNARSFYFRDNNDNILECIARFDLKEESFEPFDGSQLLCISEIGITTDKVFDERDRMRTEYGLKPYDRHKSTEEFTALGNDHGLLLLVKSGRHWYPTQDPAKKAPVMVRFRNENKEYTTKYT